jgi:hypothetical protein
MAFAALVSVIAGLVAALITGFVISGVSSPTTAALVALASFVLFMGAAPSGWFQGELRFVRYTLKSLGEISTRFLFSLLVVAFSWGTPGAVFGFAMGGLALLVTPRSFLKDLTWRPQVLRQKWRWAETAGIACTLCVVSVLVGIDVVIIAFLDGGSAAAAGFQALASIAKAPIYVAAGTVIVVFPLLRRPGVQVNAVLRAALRSFGRLALFACAVIATAPQALIAWALPQRYHDSLVLLPWLALSGLGYASITVLVTVLLGVRAYRRCQLGLGLASVLVPSGLFIGWATDGVSGLAVGCAAASVLAAAALAAISYPVLPPRSGRLAARGCVMAGGLFLCLQVVSEQPIVWLLVVILAGLYVLAQLRGGPIAAMDLLLVAAVTAEGMAKRIWSKQKAIVQGAGRPESLSFSKSLGAFVVCVAMAFGVRAIGLTQGFELWVDEMLYALLGQSVSSGEILPRLPDGPFFLHPPGFFWVEGAIINVLGVGGSNIDLVMQLRWLNALLGAVSVGLGFLIARKIGNQAAAWVTAVLLSFEPFVLRSNSHVFLETLAMATVLGGLLVLVTQLGQPLSPKRGWLLVLAGIMLGYGVLTKDFFVLCTFVPLVVAVVWRHTLHLRDSVRLLGAATLPYVGYMCIVIAQGMLPDWMRAKLGGVQRLIGLEKSTGFTAESSPSLISRLLDNAGHFGSSYILLALCPVAAALLCLSARPERRLIGLVSLSLGMYGLYSAAFGTFEEQYGYGVMIAGALSVVVLSVEVVERYPRFRKPVIAAGTVLLVLTTTLGLRLETSTDNGFSQVRQWVDNNLPPEARVTVTNSTGEVAFAEDKRFGVWPSAPLMLENKANYILTQSLPTSQGYGYVEPSMLPWLQEHASPVFILPGLTNGTTTLWFVDSDDLDAGARQGVGTPSATYETGK